MSYSLVIIDMQPEFEAANGQRVYKNVLREIKKAIEKRAPIIFVEYGDTFNTDTYTSTRRGLLKAVAGYDRVFITTKFKNDGGNKIMETIRKNRLSQNVKVCGVNTDVCVLESVNGMIFSSKKKAKIEVVADACAAYSWGLKDSHEDGLALMSKLPNVRIRR